MKKEKDDGAALLPADASAQAKTETLPDSDQSLHECDRIRLLQWGAQCDEAAKPETGPMRDAESPSGVQELGSSGLAQAIADIIALRDGARNIESSEQETELMLLWRGKAIAYETVLGRLSRIGSGTPSLSEASPDNAQERSARTAVNGHADLVEALKAIVEAINVKTLVPFDDPMAPRCRTLLDKARAALAKAGQP